MSLPSAELACVCATESPPLNEQADATIDRTLAPFRDCNALLLKLILSRKAQNGALEAIPNAPPDTTGRLLAENRALGAVLDVLEARQDALMCHAIDEDKARCWDPFPGTERPCPLCVLRMKA
jgi:hypothetical protein